MQRRAAVASLVAVLTLAACTPQELGEFLAASDIRASDNHSEAAAGHAAEAIEVDRAAQQMADEGLREESREKLTAAADQRPWDARYVAYQAALAVANGDLERTHRDIIEGYKVYFGAHSRDQTKSNVELFSEWILVFLGGMDRALSIERDRIPAEPDRVARLETAFCNNLAYYLSYQNTLQTDVVRVMFSGGADCEGVW